MFRVKSGLLTVCLAVALTSCSGSASGKSETLTGRSQYASNSTEQEQVESLNLEIDRLEVELRALSKQLADYSNQVESESALISARLEGRESELADLQKEYDLLESEKAEIAKAYQQYKNEVEQYILNGEETSSNQNISETAVEPYLTVNYRQLMQDSDYYYMRHVCISGKVVQLEERNEITQVLISFDQNEDEIILLEFNKSLLARELLQEGDEIKVYGTSFGLLEVTTAKAANVKVAGIYVDLFSIIE